MTCSRCACHNGGLASSIPCSVPGGCGTIGCGREETRSRPKVVDRDTLLRQLSDDVTALVAPRRHVEPYFRWTPGRHRKLHKHETDQDSLLDQLRAQVPPGGPESDAEAFGGPGGIQSAPPLVVDALDRLMAIEVGSARLLSVEYAQELRETVEANLRALVGVASMLALDTDVQRLAVEMHRWHGWAATLTGWESPPWRPHVACPLCATKDSLRVNLLRKHATCMACAEVWEEIDGSIGLLADYIRESDPREAQLWAAGCDHSWRLTTVGPDGIRACCTACHATEARQSWPKGTPVWTDLDEQMRGASA